MTETTEHKLRAMANGYPFRHQWDSLDAQTVKMAADEINELRAALASTSTQPTSAVEPTAKFAMTSPYVTQEQFDRVFPDTPPPVAGDAKRLDWYEAHACQIENFGKTWYWCAAYGQPHRKAYSLRAAIDAAIAAGGKS